MTVKEKIQRGFWRWYGDAVAVVCIFFIAVGSFAVGWFMAVHHLTGR